MKMKELLESSSPGVYIPKVYSQLSTRRLLVVCPCPSHPPSFLPLLSTATHPSLPPSSTLPPQTSLQSEWIDGIKLTQASQQDIRRLTKLAQECFLRQLLELGTFHAVRD